MTDYSDKERDKMPESDFGDPESRSFPIKVAADVIHAAERLHNSKGDQAAIKQRIIEIAKRKGFPLPETWQEDKQEKEVSRMGDKNNTDTGQADEPVTAVEGGVPPVLYMGVTRAYTADNGDWLVHGRAISEVVHPYNGIKTVFDYPSAKRAFERWRGNVREQHNPLKAVGHGLDWTPNDAEKAVDLVTRVSKGSPDTWEKVNDNTLTGYSIHLKPGFKTRWETINGERVLRYLDYDFLEISLVDAPGIPTCDVAIVRADGFINDAVVDISEPSSEPPSVQAVAQGGDVERAGAAVSADRMSKMHDARDSALATARKMMDACPCAECANMASKIDPDHDGDVDLPGSAADTDHDASSDALVDRVLRRAMPLIIEQLQPSVMRYQAIAGDLSRLAIPSVDLAPVQRALEAVDAQVKRLEAIETMVKEIHTMPMPGGPVLRSPDKRLITDVSGQSTQDTISDEEVLRRAAQLGIVDPHRMSSQQQVNAARSLIRPLNN